MAKYIKKKILRDSSSLWLVACKCTLGVYVICVCVCVCVCVGVGGGVCGYAYIGMWTVSLFHVFAVVEMPADNHDIARCCDVTEATRQAGRQAGVGRQCEAGRSWTLRSSNCLGLDSYPSTARFRCRAVEACLLCIVLVDSTSQLVVNFHNKQVF
jgi:hypothetical protein